MKRCFWPLSIALRIVIAAGLLAALATGCASLEVKERELLFRPVREAAGRYGGIPPAIQELYLPVSAKPDAPRIYAWWWPDDDPKAPVVYYLHGARWNLTGHVRRIEQLRRFGFSVFAIDYRGFGKSDGELPSEATVYEDARVGWDWLAKRQPDAQRRFIYGHSLGGAIAVDLAASFAHEKGHARGLIVESTFTTFAELASELTTRWLPVSLLLSQKFDSVEKIKQVRIPVLVVHGVGDRLVPSRFSEALFKAAREPKRLLLVENGSHNNSMWIGDDDYQIALAELFGLTGAPVGDAKVTRAPKKS